MGAAKASGEARRGRKRRRCTLVVICTCESSLNLLPLVLPLLPLLPLPIIDLLVLYLLLLLFHLPTKRRDLRRSKSSEPSLRAVSVTRKTAPLWLLLSSESRLVLRELLNSRIPSKLPRS